MIRRTAWLLTAAIYFIVISGVVFANRPDLLPETVKEWLNIESAEDDKEIKKDLPLDKTKKKERA